MSSIVSRISNNFANCIYITVSSRQRTQIIGWNNKMNSYFSIGSNLATGYLNSMNIYRIKRRLFSIKYNTNSLLILLPSINLSII